MYIGRQFFIRSSLLHLKHVFSRIQSDKKNSPAWPVAGEFIFIYRRTQLSSITDPEVLFQEGLVAFFIDPELCFPFFKRYLFEELRGQDRSSEALGKDGKGGAVPEGYGNVLHGSGKDPSSFGTFYLQYRHEVHLSFAAACVNVS